MTEGVEREIGIRGAGIEGAGSGRAEQTELKEKHNKETCLIPGCSVCALELSAEKQLKMKEKQKKGMKRDWMMLGLTIISTGLILSFLPDKRDSVTTISWELLVEMMMIFPAVIIMMGLFSVWVEKEMIVKHLGKASGIRGIFISLFLGALPTGPLYIAFPIAAGLMKKGARISNVIVFLSAWACIKIPQEIVELQFLGLEFMLLRLSLTIVLVIIMGIIIEKVMEWTERKNDGMEQADRSNEGAGQTGKTNAGVEQSNNVNKGPGSMEAIQHGS